MPLATWVPLVQIPISICVADETLTALRHAGYGADGCPAAVQRVGQTARSVCESFNEMAARLDDPRRGPDRALCALVADLDMFAGAGKPRAEIAAATAACLDASRADADAPRWLIGLSWATLWLGYLAHLRVLTETPLNEVAAKTEAAWWR